MRRPSTLCGGRCIRRAASDGAAGGDRQRWQNQMESREQGVAQDPLAGCRSGRSKHPDRAACQLGGPLAHHCPGTPAPPDGVDGQARLPAYPRQGTQLCVGVPHRRHRAGQGRIGDEERQLPRAGGSASQWLLQHHDQEGNGPGRGRTLLYCASAR